MADTETKGSTEDVDKTDKKNGGLGTTVASHYNKLEEVGIEMRKDSRIFHMRGFNNWVKSVLFNEFVDKLRQKDRRQLNILDIASGKGGDLKKWKIANARKVVMADIAATSVRQAEDRYKSMQSSQNARYPLFDAEFIVADCTNSRLKDMYKEPDVQFDLTSCQFAYHYSFESEAQADMMLKNACENLGQGGFFVGTTPDAREIVRRLRASNDKQSIGNSVYSVSFADEKHAEACLNPPEPESDEAKDSPPEFGLKYDFHLDGCVDCPEFLVDFSILERLAAKHNMICVYKRNFADFYQDKVKNEHNARLLHRMSALEEYPAPEGKQLSCSDPESYSTARNKLDELKQAGSHSSSLMTLSKDEWEAITLYLVFAFQKMSPDVVSSLQSSLPTRKLPLDRNLDDPVPPPAIVNRPTQRRPYPDQSGGAANKCQHRGGQEHYRGGYNRGGYHHRGGQEHYRGGYNRGDYHHRGRGECHDNRNSEHHLGDHYREDRSNRHHIP